MNKICHAGTASETRRAPLLLLSLTALLTGITASQSAQLTPFGSCAQAAMNNMHDIPRSAPEYASHLDRDGDGIACESGGQDASSTGNLNVTLPASAELLVNSVTVPSYQGVVAMNVQGRGGPQWRLHTLDHRLPGPVKMLTRTIFEIQGTQSQKIYTEVVSFDRKGRLVRYDSTPVSKKDFVYDRHIQATFNVSGQVIREVLRDSSGMEMTTYQYDQKGNLAFQTDHYDADPVRKVRYERRPAGVIERTYNLPGNEANGIGWVVIDSAFRVTQTQWSTSGTIYQTFLEYDRAGKLKQVTDLQTDGQGNAIRGLKKVVTTYQGGLPIRQETFSAGTKAERSFPLVWQYQGVDTHGNYRTATELIEVEKGGAKTLEPFRTYQQNVTYWSAR